MLRLLFIGDVVSTPGCEFLREKLPSIRKEQKIDIVIANGENSAAGNGVLPSSAKFLFDSGVDILTGGNHSFKRREIYEYLDQTPQLLRPLNYPNCPYGQGYYIYDAGRFTLCAISIMGTTFMEPLLNPFHEMDRILKTVEADYYFVDFHAEATGEKKALAYYLDGRVSCFAGTHTHVQTADEQVLPLGTGYITDAGMTGPVRSVLGVHPENIIERYRTNLPTRFTVPPGPCKMEGVLFDIDRSTKKCVHVERLIVN